MTKGKKPSPYFSELDALRKENKELRETIKNVSFVENPDLFVIRRDADNYFGFVTVRDTIELLKSQNLGDQTINFAWEVVHKDE